MTIYRGVITESHSQVITGRAGSCPNIGVTDSSLQDAPLVQPFHGGNLANVEVLFLVCCYLDGPNACPFGGRVNSRKL